MTSTRAEQITFMTDNLGLMSDTDKDQIEAVLKMGDLVGDLVIKSIYSEVLPQLQSALKCKADKVKAKDKAKELFVDGIASISRAAAGKGLLPEADEWDEFPPQVGYVTKTTRTTTNKDTGENETVTSYELLDCNGVTAKNLAGYLIYAIEDFKVKCQKEAESLINGDYDDDHDDDYDDDYEQGHG